MYPVHDARLFIGLKPAMNHATIPLDLKHYAHSSDRINIIPAFLDHWTSWEQEVGFLVIAICPALLNQTTQSLAQRKIELIPQFSIDDQWAFRPIGL